MRLSVSPATPFSDASLPNHTKMFELVHLVTSVDDFVYGTCSTESRRIKRDGRKRAIVTVSADGRGWERPKQDDSKNSGPLPVYSLSGLDKELSLLSTILKKIVFVTQPQLFILVCFSFPYM